MVEHIPVLYQEIIQYLQPRSGGLYIDGTIGSGGHASGILEASAPDGRLLGFDRDPEAVAHAIDKLSNCSERITVVNESFGDMGEVAPLNGFNRVDGILLDLGLSSRQLADNKRGFSFNSSGPLDMRFDIGSGLSAADLVNDMSSADLANLFRKYGEVRSSKRIANAIVEQRPISSANELSGIVERESRGRWRIHPATQVFQALRIAVNDELEELPKGLKAATQLMKEGARLAVISFHSLEDRIVKNYFRDLSRDCICPPEQPICTCDTEPTFQILTRKVVRPSEEEVINNPRSRSARLRVSEKILGE
jgi:16S rRNA (cytosine1402-N4)-methyltransferase